MSDSGRGGMALRRMTVADLASVRMWLTVPDVALWYLAGSTIEQEIEDLRRCIVGDEPTQVLIVTDGGSPIGWCQWYLCSDYPDHAAGVGARPDDVGIDYAIGDPTVTGRGAGSALIAALVNHIKQMHPHAGIIADPEASNIRSRKVLENNGFQLFDVRRVASEPTQTAMAIYRLPAAAQDGDGT